MPLPPRPRPIIDEPRAYVVEAVDGMLPFGRYRIYLSLGSLRTGGNSGWGWLRWTARTAHRKGARELQRLDRREQTLSARQARADLMRRDS